MRPSDNVSNTAGSELEGQVCTSTRSPMPES